MRSYGLAWTPAALDPNDPLVIADLQHLQHQYGDEKKYKATCQSCWFNSEALKHPEFDEDDE